MARDVALLFLLLGVAAASDVFYYNTATGESVWSRPESMPILDESSGHSYWVIGGEATWDPPEEYAWLRHRDDHGNVYYENTVNKEVEWTPPAPAAWTARSADKFFYHNKVTKETTWEKPAVLGHEDTERGATYYVDEGGHATWDKPEDAAWSKHDHEGADFFHNDKTLESSWELPAASVHAWEKIHTEM